MGGLPDANRPPSLAHDIEIVATVGPPGRADPELPRRPDRRQRQGGAVFGLFLEGHQMHGQAGFGSWENLRPLINAWLDGRDAPPPYNWSRP